MRTIYHEVDVDIFNISMEFNLNKDTDISVSMRCKFIYDKSNVCM